MTIRSWGAVVLVAFAMALVAALWTVAPAEQSAPAKTKWTTADALPLTCAQAWMESGKSYPGMLAIVKILARVSLANRNLTFPNTREAGLQAGRAIADDCKDDPDALLFQIVDTHVR